MKATIPERTAVLHILQHSLGMDQHGQGRSYRNHFVTGEGSDDHPHCMSAVADGLMLRRRGSPLSGGDDVFMVTERGIAYVKERSPAPVVHRGPGDRGDPLEVLTAMFEAPCLLPAQRRTLWTMPAMVRPAMVGQRFGAGDLLIALSPLMHRPKYYLVWIDRKWYPEQFHCEDELYEQLDEIWCAIEEEFGRRDREDDRYRWPEVDDADGSCWRHATADDILTPRLRRAWCPSFQDREGEPV